MNVRTVSEVRATVIAGWTIAFHPVASDCAEAKPARSAAIASSDSPTVAFHCAPPSRVTLSVKPPASPPVTMCDSLSASAPSYRSSPVSSVPPEKRACSLPVSRRTVTWAKTRSSNCGRKPERSVAGLR